MKKIILITLTLMFLSGFNTCYANEPGQQAVLTNETGIEGTVQENVYYTNKSFTSRKYILGPNDIIDINFMGMPEFNKKSARIQPDGYLTLDLPEPVFAAGLSLGDFQKKLIEEYKYYIVDPRISVNLIETKPFIVYISGAVLNPGSYELDTNPARTNYLDNIKPETKIERKTPLLSNILVAAGGIKYDADIEHVKITNSLDNTEYEVNLLELLETNNTKHDVYLTAGDCVHVPKLPTAFAVSDEKYNKYVSSTFSPRSVPVRVLGYVNKPGIVHLDPKYTLNLNSAITEAGSYMTGRANPPKKVYLSRVDGNGKLVTKKVNPRTNDITLRPNDIIYVPEKVRPKVVRLFSDLTSIFTPADVFANSYNNWALMFDKNRFDYSSR